MKATSQVDYAKVIISELTFEQKQAVGILLEAASEASARAVRTSYEESALLADDEDDREFTRYANVLQGK